jgi:hypothetical protein
MRKLGAIILVLGLTPALAVAEPLPDAAEHGAQIGPLQTLTGQLVAGRIQEVETRFMTGITGNLDEIRRLRSDASRRNDSIAAACVEQKLAPAQNLRAAASKAAARLRGIPANDIDALNGEVRNLSTAADRVGELATEARSCLKINSGQIVTNVKMTPDSEFELAKDKGNEQLADLIVPRRPDATPYK